MAVRIRLSRIGATKQPSYRVVVMDSRGARDSRPSRPSATTTRGPDPVEFVVDAEKVKKWLAQGALPSDTVSRLLQNAGITPKVARKVAPPAK